MSDAGVRTDVAVAVVGERIEAVAPIGELREQYQNAREIDCRNGVLTPGFVDSHTHGVFGRPRFDEQELRAAGHDYMEIARRGGGIHSSVRDLRSRSEETLFELPDRGSEEVRVEEGMVRERLRAIAEDEDLRKYIL